MEDIKSVTVISERTTHRMLVADTDVGADLQLSLIHIYRQIFVDEAWDS